MTPWRALLDAAAPACAALDAACRDPRAQQAALLRQIVRDNGQTQFGQAHGFDGIDTMAAFRARVPVRGYDALRPWIERLCAGERGVLTCADVIAFEETGGSAAGPKLIPYTAASLSAFGAGVLPWLASLAQRRPGVCAGPAYAAISPRLRPARALACGTAIGLPNEAAYLGASLQAPLAALLVAPDTAMHADVAQWRAGTLAALVSRPDLAFVSIYSPTFLLELIDALPDCADDVARRLTPEHRTRLQSALAGGRVDTRTLWPRLDTIAAWTEGASAAYAARLAARFPHVHLDPRGVLATESAVTVRCDGGEGCVPALTSAVFEFVDDDGALHAVDALVAGQRYRVLLTTPGGLYRYDLQDQFECVGHLHRAPRLRFLGRCGVASDLVGEKLTDAFVADALGRLPLPAALVPAHSTRPHYELWVDGAAQDPDALARGADALLQRNPQYRYARDSGQLGALRVIASPGLMRHRHATLVRRGMRAGDIKPAALLLDRSTLPQRHDLPPQASAA